MTTAKNLALIIATVAVVAVVSALVSKLCWDSYQMRRASEQIPKVVALIEQMRIFPGSSRIESEPESPSANEYAASVWRYYRSDANCLDVQRHLDSEALRNGFDFESVNDRNGTREVFHRKEQYEFRALFQPQTGPECNYAVSVNWDGWSR